MIGWLLAVSGAAAGAAQVGLLGRSVRRGLDPLGLLARIGLVAAVLVLAATTGHLAMGAAGWFAGFALAVGTAQRRLG
jgi:hypothetical protein